MLAAFALRLRAFGTVPSEEAALLRFAGELGSRLAALAREERWEAIPPFLGRTRGIERAGETTRLVCAAELRAVDGPLGVVFTTLIAGRRPEVAVAPPGTPIAEDWTSRIAPS